MKRSIDQWRGCNPESMAAQSKAAIRFALEDAKADIIELHDMLDEINDMLTGPLTSEDAYMVADYFNDTGWRK